MINSHDRIRGAADIPLTPEGHAQVQELGGHFQRNGPLDTVISSDLQRTRDTAHAIAGDAPVIITPHLRDINYGRFTGMQTRDVIVPINKAILKTPDAPVDGAGGESFNHYKDRLTGVTKLAIEAGNAHPDARIGLVVNRRSIKTIQAWLDNGKMDNNFKAPTLVGDDPNLKPGTVFRIDGHKEGDYAVNAVDTTQPMGPGIYLIRHGLTAWNGESHPEPKPLPPPIPA